MRRLDRRVPRRVGRRLKAHLRECRACERFENVQRRQRAVLKGLSVMPVPASLFLFRAKEAAAAALGPAAVAGGGSMVVGGGTAVGAGGAGITVGVAAKVAAVTAAAAVAGGVGYGVSTGRPAEANLDRKVVQAPAVGAPRDARVAMDIRPARAGRARPAAITPAARKRDEAKSRPMERAAAGKEFGGTPEKTSRGHKARLGTPAATKPTPRPTGDKVGARTTTTRPKQKPTRRAAPSQRRSTPAPGRSATAAPSNQRTHRRPVTPMRVEQPPKTRGGKSEPLQ
jgi:hypothetical protein